MYLTNLDPAQKVWVDKTEEKGSDVNLASHLLRDAYTGKFEIAVLITNDSDLAEPVRIVAQELGLPVGILNPHQFHSRELRQYATFLKRIRQGDLAASQFPRTVTDRKGTFAKPAGWQGGRKTGKRQRRNRYISYNCYKNSYSDNKQGQPFRVGLFVNH